MELIAEFKDADKPQDTSHIRTREASRAILFDQNNMVPLLFVSKHKYHKLPGGGIDAGEDKSQALIRECLEELGAEIEVDGVVGSIFEYRSKYDLFQYSYCYYGKVISKGEPSFTEKEIANGFQVVWMTLDQAIDQLERDEPDDYEGFFVRQRDLALLQKMKEIRKDYYS